MALKAVVKNTFVEVVKAADDADEQPRILTAQTDSKALGIWNCRDGLFWSDDDDSSDSGPADEIDPAAVAAKTAKTAAVLAAAEAASAADAIEAAASVGEATPAAAAEAAAVAEAAAIAAFALVGRVSPIAKVSPKDVAKSADGAGPEACQEAFAMGPERPWKPLPDLGMGGQLVVRNTFLDYADEEEPQGKIAKSSTDSAALLRCEVLPEELDGLRLQFQACWSASSGKVGEAAPSAVAAMPEVKGNNLLAAPRPHESATVGMSPIVEELSPRPTGSSGFGGLPAAPPTHQAPVPATAPSITPPSPNREDFSLSEGLADAGPTTLMLRNVPNDYSRSMVLELMDASGFQGKFDFIYYPKDFSRQAGLGYAFLNMRSASDARQVGIVLEGFRRWSVPSSKVCSVTWNVPCQGLEANIERYRNSPVMHKSVPDEFKPALFKDGERIQFPKPTRRIRKPDTRRGGC
uniref:Mei2-like C-terminal RNA recognition motif domain-containing protein n=1 Tax=Alexandrium catenella TaxID=2925 RepID=A0A7S1QQM8_ALECA